jgi:hypothetical protein
MGKKKQVKTDDELIEEYMELDCERSFAIKRLDDLIADHDKRRAEFFERNKEKLRAVTDAWQRANEEYEQIVKGPVSRMEEVFRYKQRPFKEEIDRLNKLMFGHPGERLLYEEQQREAQEDARSV